MLLLSACFLLHKPGIISTLDKLVSHPGPVFLLCVHPYYLEHCAEGFLCTLSLILTVLGDRHYQLQFTEEEIWTQRRSAMLQATLLLCYSQDSNPGRSDLKLEVLNY